MGGTGKTPFTAFLATRIREKGGKAAVVMRGYKGRLSKRGAVAGQGNGPLLSAGEVGDEAFMLARQLDGIPVYIGADRAKQVERARDDGVDVAILDDGFQHRRLHRDVNILLAAPAHLVPDAPLFPLGTLREPADAVRRADLVGGPDAVWRDDNRADFTFDIVASHLEDGDGSSHSPDALSGKVVVLLAAIAHPERFEATIKSLGANVAMTMFFEDHHSFTSSELGLAERAREKNADVLVTTEKDWARLSPNHRRILSHCVVLCIRISLKRGRKKMDEMIRRLVDGGF